MKVGCDVRYLDTRARSDIGTGNREDVLQLSGAVVI